MTTKEFQSIVWKYYKEYGRKHLPWRGDYAPYRVLVSELMLQQTQVERVIPKFQEFMQIFPSIEVLAKASLGDVLKTWQGLGYNRRAKFLHEAARAIIQKGHFPIDAAELTTLPGIGRNTAGAIGVYAFNQPLVYIETNIRTVYLHHFFPGSVLGIEDSELLPLIEKTLDRENPRLWYAALMDYGAYLKSQGLGKITASKHYKKQSRFHGSPRQLRGAVVRELAGGAKTFDELQQQLADDRLEAVITQLRHEGMIVDNRGVYTLPAI